MLDQSQRRISYVHLCKNTKQLYQHEWNWENMTPEGRSVFIQFRIFPTSTSVDITVYQYRKNVLYLFYNIAMSKARRIRKISVFTSGGNFPCFH